MQNIPTPLVSTFNEINIGKFITTQHFEVADEHNAHDTHMINLAKDRQFAKSLPDYWLSYRLNERWQRITGLFNIAGTNYYKGDTGFLDKAKHLIIARIDAENRQVTTYTFKNYFTKDVDVILHLIKNGIK
jgi:hypothetical protein